MKHELILGIAATSLLAAPAYAAPQAPATASQPAKGGGKCASGKCGTEKIYSQTKLQHDPNGVLVRARDGKCGLTGKGYKVAENSRSRLAEGVCGR
ncbi:hypothetical protein [Novosphingobium pokkalii]|uniref:Uncharacterized protein n=1 Tax=Novosphingobium pokkalii TaxID=1770194 RepID=A0ABV7V4N9_9SPHN|nr:hypothetical protein [Novosphingobium pokkalii]GHD00855.1 hypothetical protein GCM10019060_34940 [Novosphingobium pokkalii]